VLAGAILREPQKRFSDTAIVGMAQTVARLGNRTTDRHT